MVMGIHLGYGKFLDLAALYSGLLQATLELQCFSLGSNALRFVYHWLSSLLRKTVKIKNEQLIMQRCLSQCSGERSQSCTNVYSVTLVFVLGNVSSPWTE